MFHVRGREIIQVGEREQEGNFGLSPGAGAAGAGAGASMCLAAGGGGGGGGGTSPAPEQAKTTEGNQPYFVVF
jgi:hypothetical protein